MKRKFSLFVLMLVLMMQSFAITGFADPAPLSYSINAIGNVTLPPVSDGYASGTQSTAAIPIQNTGTGDLTNLAAVLSGGHTDAFVIYAGACLNIGCRGTEPVRVEPDSLGMPGLHPAD